MSDRYEPKSFEDKWRKRWAEADLFRTREEEGRPKFYALDFFPYPSGAGLSVGHCRNYVPTDVIARMKFMQGYNVLHPMGFDAFGLPAENEAIKTRRHPAPMVKQYGETYRRQMDLIGISYDWSREIYSSDPTYYRWTQWIFKLLFERGLAERRLAPVNWDPVEKTVLADEEVIGGRGWRSGALVEKKFIPQWFFRITDYAQRLLDDLDLVDWPEGIKQMQRNWIGRSEGVEFAMKVKFAREREASDPPADADFVVLPRERERHFRVFTTRIDTVFGVTFCVLAPEHPLVETIVEMVEPEHADAIRAYQREAATMGETTRQAADREKTGVFTGAYAINPANGKAVPIYLADYVLMGYGTGAIMAVPGHDQRDFDFAKKYGLDIVPVIAPENTPEGIETVRRMFEEGKAYEAKDGVMVNSGEYSGLSFSEGQRRLGEWMEGLGIGERKVTYKLRDWLISRQRYWGCPIPIIHEANGDMTAVPDDCLPVLLPEVENYEPAGDGSSPLSQIESFVNVTDSQGRLGRRETDTMGGFACSSWYFLRFCDPHNDAAPFDKGKADYWMPVDCYVGGAEHAVMHLLYARFWTKVLYDAGLVSVKEPFQRLMNQGMVLAETPFRKPREGETLEVGEDGILITAEEAKKLPADQVFTKWVKMSKSKYNVVTPEEAVDAFGADALRLYELFVAPFDQEVQWSNDGLNGLVRFLNRVFRFVDQVRPVYDPEWRSTVDRAANPTAAAIRRSVHRAIIKSTEDIDKFAFNTYVSTLMICLNELTDLLKDPATIQDPALRPAISEAVESFVLLLAPAAPFSADELWERLGRPGFTYRADWPIGNPSLAAADTVTVAVQVNGKLRDTIDMPASASDAELEEAALASPKVQAHIDGKTVRKVVVVPGKLVNVVVG
ncbi:MAG: leucine--tRNA ligase [Fimbriimonadaceae bacterium]